MDASEITSLTLGLGGLASGALLGWAGIYLGPKAATAAAAVEADRLWRRGQVAEICTGLMVEALADGARAAKMLNPAPDGLVLPDIPYPDPRERVLLGSRARLLCDGEINDLFIAHQALVLAVLAGHLVPGTEDATAAQIDATFEAFIAAVQRALPGGPGGGGQRATA